MDLFLPIFAALDDAGVRYLVVGGLATVLHGYARFTADIDLIVQLESSNCLRAIDTLAQLGFKPRAPIDPVGLASPEARKDWIRTKGLTVLSFYQTSGLPLEVDIFVEEPMDFSELWSKRVQRVIKHVRVQVIDKISLIALKRTAGRVQDLADVKALLEIADIE